MKRIVVLPRCRNLAFVAFTAAGLIACGRTPPNLVAESEVLIGESPEVIATGLIAGATYSVTAEMTDALLRVWRSEASFKADEHGRIELATGVPTNDIYQSRDPLGMLSSMTLATTLPDDWEPPEPRDFNDVVFKLSRDGSELDSVSTRQWIFPPAVSSAPIGGGLVAEIFHRRDVAGAVGVILVGGSGGGMGWARRSAALLAHHGVAAMAVAYFNSEGLPPDLVEIPLEYIDEAIDSLRSRPEVDPARIVLMGYSKGAELALLVASRRPDVGSVVAIAPGSAVFQGFRAPDYPVISSWSVDGVGLPFVRNAYDKKFFETFDGMYLWYRTLRQHDQFAPAAIPVEKINGDILLISGIDDQIWPATFMGEQIVARLHLNDFDYRVRHLAFPEAGHGIAAPPGEPLTSVARRLGGTVEGNANARGEGWSAIVDFLTSTSID